MKVLIVDDSSFAISMIRKVVESMEGYEVVGEAKDGRSAYKQAQNLNPDIITLDNILPDTIGTKLIKPLKKLDPDVKILMISAIQQATVTQEAIDLGADDYLVKPFQDRELIEALTDLKVNIGW
ncbi:MAG: response regulator [Flammeovirgaceae bacterium]